MSPGAWFRKCANQGQLGKNPGGDLKHAGGGPAQLAEESLGVPQEQQEEGI